MIRMAISCTLSPLSSIWNTFFLQRNLKHSFSNSYFPIDNNSRYLGCTNPLGTPVPVMPMSLIYHTRVYTICKMSRTRVGSTVVTVPGLAEPATEVSSSTLPRWDLMISIAILSSVTSGSHTITSWKSATNVRRCLDCCSCTPARLIKSTSK